MSVMCLSAVLCWPGSVCPQPGLNFFLWNQLLAAAKNAMREVTMNLNSKVVSWTAKQTRNVGRQSELGVLRETQSTGTLWCHSKSLVNSSYTGKITGLMHENIHERRWDSAWRIWPLHHMYIQKYGVLRREIDFIQERSVLHTVHNR